MTDKKETQNLISRMLASLLKAILIGLIKVIGLAIYFTARAIEIIAGQIAQKLKPYVND